MYCGVGDITASKNFILIRHLISADINKGQFLIKTRRESVNLNALKFVLIYQGQCQTQLNTFTHIN